MTDTLYKLCAKIELPTAKSVVRGNINSSIFLRWRRPINQKRSSLLEQMKNRIKVILIENHSWLLRQQNSNILKYTVLRENGQIQVCPNKANQFVKVDFSFNFEEETCGVFKTHLVSISCCDWVKNLTMFLTTLQIFVQKQTMHVYHLFFVFIFIKLVSINNQGYCYHMLQEVMYHVFNCRSAMRYFSDRISWSKAY